MRLSLILALTMAVADAHRLRIAVLDCGGGVWNTDAFTGLGTIVLPATGTTVLTASNSHWPGKDWFEAPRG